MVLYAYSSAQSIYSLLENLLQWARIQVGGVECNRVVLDLRQVSRSVLDLLSAIAREKEISLSLQMDALDDSWNVYTDQQLLSTVLRNLICNALKFTPPGGQVTISAAHQGSKFVEVSVADTGVGISDSDQARLLKTGIQHTTLGTMGEMGTGLGLIICQEMINRLQGRLWLESQLGQGTTVRFTIPAAPDAIEIRDHLSRPGHKHPVRNHRLKQLPPSLGTAA